MSTELETRLDRIENILRGPFGGNGLLGDVKYIRQTEIPQIRKDLNELNSKVDRLMAARSGRDYQTGIGLTLLGIGISVVAVGGTLLGLVLMG